jgi:hypothetical protein
VTLQDLSLHFRPRFIRGQERKAWIFQMYAVARAESHESVRRPLRDFGVEPGNAMPYRDIRNQF